MSEHTPSIEQVRAAYIATQRRFVEDPVLKQDIAADFDRWLADLKRQVRVGERMTVARDLIPMSGESRERWLWAGLVDE